MSKKGGDCQFIFQNVSYSGKVEQHICFNVQILA
jgi:hypothetical protein